MSTRSLLLLVVGAAVTGGTVVTAAVILCERSGQLDDRRAKPFSAREIRRAQRPRRRRLQPLRALGSALDKFFGSGANGNAYIGEVWAP